LPSAFVVLSVQNLFYQVLLLLSSFLLLVKEEWIQEQEEADCFLFVLLFFPQMWVPFLLLLPVLKCSVWFLSAAVSIFRLSSIVPCCYRRCLWARLLAPTTTAAAEEELQQHDTRNDDEDDDDAATDHINKRMYMLGNPKYSTNTFLIRHIL
jgi:hypothetical protein